MGIRDELQTEVAAAFDTDLQDAVKDFTGSYTVRGAWNPVTETGTETQVTYSGRGVLARYKLRRIDGVDILHGDVKLAYTPERGVALLKQNPSLYWLILAEAAAIAQGKEQQTQETVKKP